MDARMKNIVKIVCVGCLVASAALAESVGVLGAYQIPKDGDDGYGGMVRYQWDIDSETEGTRLFAQGGYLTGMGENDRSSDGGETLKMDVDMEIAPVEFGILQDIAMTQQGALYVGAGVGYYFIDNSMSTNFDAGSFPGNATVDASIDFEDQFGAFALMGWEQDLAGNLSCFAEVRYTYLDVDTDSNWTITASETIGDTTYTDTEVYSESDDYNLSGLGAAVGLLWRW